MRRDAGSRAFIAAVVFASLTAAPVRAQTGATQTASPPAPTTAGAANPVVRLVPADVPTLADALRAISKQTGAAFVCEGKPFRARNSPAPLLPVVAKWPQNGLPLNDAVQKIAAAYDYEAERNGGIFLLRKRYTNPDDLPDVTAEELRLSLRDVVRSASGLPAPVADTASSAKKNAAFTEAFYQTLTPEQIKRLSGNAGFSTFVQVSELNPAQKQMMRDLVVNRHIQKATGEAERAQANLRECDQKSTAFGRFEMQSLPAYISKEAKAADPNAKPRTQTVRALCCMVRENGKDALVPFAPDGRMRFHFANRRIGYRSPKEDADASAPTPADFGASHEPLPPPEETGSDSFTLQTLADALHQKSIQIGAGIAPPTFALQGALSAKSVTVVGIKSDNGEALWRAAGAVYGLRVFRAKINGPLFMQRPRAQVARDLAGLDAAAFSAFPAPLIRLYRGAFQTEEADRMSKPSGLEVPPDASESLKANFLSFQKQSAHQMAAFDAPERLKKAVLHRFRVLLEPRLTKENNERVLYADMGEKAHDLWTMLLFVDCLGNASSIENETLPATITDFDKGYLSSHINDGFGATEPFLQFTFWVRNEKAYHHIDGGGVFPVPDDYHEKKD